jgi:hypothetical protein
VGLGGEFSGAALLGGVIVTISFRPHPIEKAPVQTPASPQVVSLPLAPFLIHYLAVF